MISFFTVPKPFVGSTGQRQRNAIGSWRTVVPGAQLLLCGDETGTDAVAREFGAEQLSDVRRSPHGVPLLDDVFRQAQEAARHDVLCFLNTDIILRGDTAVLQRLPAPFLVIGESLDVEVKHRVQDDDSAWRASFGTAGRSRGPLAIDYFFFSRGLFGNIPPFAIGRARFDNWLIWRALRCGAMVVDGTEALQAIHQRHSYDHLKGGRHEAYRGADARRNQELAGVWCYLHLYSILDARWRLTPGGTERIPRRSTFLRQLRLRGAAFLAEHARRAPAGQSVSE